MQASLDALFGGLYGSSASDREPSHDLRSPTANTDDRLVLVVDDDREVNDLVKDMLETRGYRVDQAYDGEQGLVRAVNSTPDLLIVDVCMPHMDGGTLLEKVKRHPGLRDMPVVMITGLATKDVVDWSINAGTSDFIVKPIRLEVLLTKVARLLAFSSTNHRRDAI